MGHSGLQHIGHRDVVVNITGDIGSVHSPVFGLSIEPLHFTVQTVSHQFERDIGIAIDTRRLALTGKKPENIIDVCHVEVSAKTKILCSPVVSSQEGMHILQSALSRRGITQMTHVELSGKRIVNTPENLCDGILAFCPLTEHIFLAYWSIQVDTSYASSLLSAIMLLLHHQIELIQSVTPGAILLLIV